MLAALLLVAIVAAAATAGKSDKPKVRAAANGTARASAFALVNQLRALQAVEGKLTSALPKVSARTAAKTPAKLTQKITLASAADGPYLFAATTEVTLNLSNNDYEVTELRTRVTRTDHVAGSTKVIFDRKDTYVLALVARGGSVAFQDVKYKVEKKKIKVDSKVYKGAYADATFAPIESGKLEFGEWLDPICGDAPLLAAISEKGEAVIGRVKATCAKDKFEFTADLGLVRADGSRVDLGPLSLDDSASTSIVLTGDRLLQTSPFERAAALRNVSTNKLTNLWNPGTQTADIGPDGTVVMVGTSDEEQYTYSFEEFDEEDFDAPEPGERFDFPEPKRTLNPDFRMPFVVFPQGDAENPVLVAASRARLNALKFCGTNLYALESKSKTSEAPDGDDLLTGLAGFPTTQRGPFEVQILDNQGALVKSLGKTKPMTVVGVGCNSDKFVIIAQQGAGVKAVELGP